jgi:hypothetical protein
MVQQQEVTWRLQQRFEDILMHGAEQQEVTCSLSAFHSWLLLYICDLSGGNIVIDNFGCYQR